MPTLKWTLEKIKKEAAKYNTKGEFSKGSPGAYNAGRERFKEHWSEITSHMQVLWEEKWDYETVEEEAAKHDTVKSFREACDGGYQRACVEGWLDKITAHMDKSRIYKWDFDAVKKEASTFKSRGQFAAESSSAYAAARERGWLDEVCAHMKIQYNGFLHCRYLIINERLKQVYVGVTAQQYEIRMIQHRTPSNPTKSASIANLEDTDFIQESDYIYTPDEVKEGAEKELIEEYTARGYEVLNEESAIGNVGFSKRKWTKQLCQLEADKYESRWEFQKKSPAAQKAAQRHGWMDEICSHMKVLNKGPFTEELALEIASEFKSTTELKEAEEYTYNWLLKNNLMDKVHKIWGTEIKEKSCVACGKKFTPIKNHYQRYCTTTCRERTYNQNRRQRKKRMMISKRPRRDPFVYILLHHACRISSQAQKYALLRVSDQATFP